MKFAICQELFEDWDWERQCRFIAEVGYTGIEVAPFTLAGRIEEVSPQRRRELRQQAETHGLSIIGLHWLLAKTEGLHLTSADPAVRRALTEAYPYDTAQTVAAEVHQVAVIRVTAVARQAGGSAFRRTAVVRVVPAEPDEHFVYKTLMWDGFAG